MALTSRFERPLHPVGHAAQAEADAASVLDVTCLQLGARAFSMPGLQRFPRQTLGPMAITCMAGRPVSHVQAYAGLRLTDVLDAVGFSKMPRHELKRCAVVALGADGYHAVFSWNELYNSPLGAGVLILYERDGVPLDEHMGTLCLISSHDQLIGPRHLRQLGKIDVQRL